MLLLYCCFFAVSYGWSNDCCDKKTALLLLDLDPTILADISPSCFSQLVDIKTTELAAVVPFLPENIFANCDGCLSKETLKAISQRQMARFGEDDTKAICSQLQLDFLNPIVYPFISPSCLHGALTSIFAESNAASLPFVSEQAFSFSFSGGPPCPKIDVKYLLPINDAGILKHVSPLCFAGLANLGAADLTTIINHLPENIFSEYNGCVSSSTVKAWSPRQFENFASNISGKICQRLFISSIEKETFAYISPRCLVSILSGLYAEAHYPLLASISRTSLQYLMTNPNKICSKLSATLLQHLPDSMGGLVDSKCFAAMQDVEIANFGSKIETWPVTFLEYYDGHVSQASILWISAENMAHYARKVNGPFICTKINLYDFPYSKLTKISTICLVNYIQARNPLGELWYDLIQNGQISLTLWNLLLESIVEDDLSYIPVENWDYLYHSIGSTLPELFRFRSKKKFLFGLCRNRGQFVWLAYALKSRRPQEVRVIQEIQRRIIAFPEADRDSIIFTLRNNAQHWVDRVVALILIRFTTEAELLLRKTYVYPQDQISIKLKMINGVFDFAESFNYVTIHSNLILSEHARLQDDGYSDYGGPMRQWIDQMLQYIVGQGLLEVISDNEVRFPFMADPRVGVFVGVVYAKAIQMNIKPPLTLHPSLMLLCSRVGIEDWNRYFDRVYGPDLDDFARQIQYNRSEQEFDKAMAHYEFIEPMSLPSWHPLEAPVSIMPEDLTFLNLTPSKVYTAQTFKKEYMKKMKSVCMSRFMDLVVRFGTRLDLTFDIYSYGYLLEHTLICNLFGVTIISPEAVWNSIKFDSVLTDIPIPSLFGRNHPITLVNAFKSIVFSLDQKQLLQFVTVITGSRMIRIEAFKFNIDMYHQVIEVPAKLAYGPGSFFGDETFTEVLERMIKFQQVFLEMNPSSMYTVEYPSTYFLGSYCASCSTTIFIVPQSSYQLLLSIMQLLDQSPAAMYDGMALAANPSS